MSINDRDSYKRPTFYRVSANLNAMQMINEEIVENEKEELKDSLLRLR